MESLGKLIGKAYIIHKQEKVKLSIYVIFSLLVPKYFVCPATLKRNNIYFGKGL